MNLTLLLLIVALSKASFNATVSYLSSLPDSNPVIGYTPIVTDYRQVLQTLVVDTNFTIILESNIEIIFEVLPILVGDYSKVEIVGTELTPPYPGTLSRKPVKQLSVDHLFVCNQIGSESGYLQFWAGAHSSVEENRFYEINLTIICGTFALSSAEEVDMRGENAMAWLVWYLLLGIIVGLAALLSWVTV